MDKRFALLLNGLFWMASSLMLLKKGIERLVFSGEEFFLGAALLFFVVGYAKGKFVLQKKARERALFIQNYPGKIPVSQLFSKKMLFLVFFMMGIGIGIKYLPINKGYLGLLDGAISLALFLGAYPFFKALLSPQKDLST